MAPHAHAIAVLFPEDTKSSSSSLCGSFGGLAREALARAEDVGLLRQELLKARRRLTSTDAGKESNSREAREDEACRQEEVATVEGELEALAEKNMKLREAARSSWRWRRRPQHAHREKEERAEQVAEDVVELHRRLESQNELLHRELSHMKAHDRRSSRSKLSGGPVRGRTTSEVPELSEPGRSLLLLHHHRGSREQKSGARSVPLPGALSAHAAPRLPAPVQVSRRMPGTRRSSPPSSVPSLSVPEVRRHSPGRAGSPEEAVAAEVSSSEAGSASRRRVRSAPFSGVWHSFLSQTPRGAALSSKDCRKGRSGVMSHPVSATERGGIGHSAAHVPHWVAAPRPPSPPISSPRSQSPPVLTGALGLAVGQIMEEIARLALEEKTKGEADRRTGSKDDHHNIVQRTEALVVAALSSWQGSPVHSKIV